MADVYFRSRLAEAGVEPALEFAIKGDNAVVVEGQDLSEEGAGDGLSRSTQKEQLSRPAQEMLPALRPLGPGSVLMSKE